jgi:hypothetical protein
MQISLHLIGGHSQQNKARKIRIKVKASLFAVDIIINLESAKEFRNNYRVNKRVQQDIF